MRAEENQRRPEGAVEEAEGWSKVAPKEVRMKRMKALIVLGIAVLLTAPSWVSAQAKAPAKGAKVEATTPLLDLNTATKAELEALPAIGGRVRAEDHRRPPLQGEE
jgi:DNA uptake protein ComE-like DNA-binding protein